MVYLRKDKDLKFWRNNVIRIFFNHSVFNF